MENEKVRQAARAAHVPLWKIADEIGVSEPTMTRWLRKPLSEKLETEIMTAINKLALVEKTGGAAE